MTVDWNWIIHFSLLGISFIILFISASSNFLYREKLVAYIRKNKPKLYETLTSYSFFGKLRYKIYHFEISRMGLLFPGYLFVKNPEDDEKILYYKKIIKYSYIIILITFIILWGIIK